ncbi:glycosyltransferase family 2 protein [bacterium]|nr:glycosyltransferase family 2 protein [bacterium]
MIIILLPAYNEENSILPLFESLDASLQNLGDYRIVVVDDGSSDKTPEILDGLKSTYPLTVLTHETNMNLGRAMLTGLSWIRDNASDDDLVITMDADNTHSPDVIQSLIDNAENGDVGIASRYEKGGGERGLSGFRSVMSRGAGFLLQMAFHVPNVRDYTCGFRLYHPRIIRRGFEKFGDDFVSEAGFTAMAEILIRLHFTGAKFYEVPLLLRYDLKSSPSKMHIFRTVMRYFRLISKLKRVGRKR